MKLDIELFIEFVKIILPVLITGIFTFLITKYTYHKNIPLDKLEISYNRIYYPIFCIISECKDINAATDKCEIYLKKYKKYVDKSTIKAFGNIKNSKEEVNVAYENFRDNIITICGSLRRRLGYLEPNIFFMYKFSAPEDKRMCRMLLEIGSIYIALSILLIVKNEMVQIIATIMIIGGIAIWGVEILAWIFVGIIKYFKKIFLQKRSQYDKQRN